MKTCRFMILAFLGLHGCTTVEDPLLDSFATADIGATTGNRELPPHLAIASLTGIGEAPVSLRQTQGEGRTTQVAVFPNATTVPGENTLSVTTPLASGPTMRKGPDRREIVRTLKMQFPGLAMNIEPRIRQNPYGPYGVATGRLGDKGGCVYAWQTIGKNAVSGLDADMQIRLRYCHPQIAPEILADILAGLTLRNPGSPANLSANALYAYSTPRPATITENIGISSDERPTVNARPAATPRSTEAEPEVRIPLPD